MAMRYVLSAVSFSFARKAPVAVAPEGAKADVDVAFVSVDEEAGKVVVAVPPYDLATHSHLKELRAYLLPVADVDKAGDAQALLASAYPFGLADVSGLQVGGHAELTLPAVPDGDHAGRVVLGFDA